MDRKQCLVSLHILPVMMTYELNDIMFLSDPSKTPLQTLIPSTTFRSAHFLPDLRHTMNSSSSVQGPTNIHVYRHLYFLRLTMLWNSLPPFDLSLPIRSLSHQLKTFMCMVCLPENFNPDLPCTYHFIFPCCKCALNPPLAHFSLPSL